MQVPWSTVVELAQTRSVEVIINFPMGMAIQRLLTRSGELRPGWEEALDAYFGSPEWRQQVYEDESGLFGAQRTKRPDAGTRLLEWYRLRLKQVFGNVSTPRLITNTRGGHLYYLIWAGPHAKGKEGADHILKMGESVATHRKVKRK
jgi:three-Cys-motif partner protein